MLNKISDVKNELDNALEIQRSAQLEAGAPSLTLREDRINRAIDILVSNKEAFQETLNADFGHRSRDLTDIADLAASVGELRHARKHLSKWARHSNRSLELPLGLIGAKGWVEYQPKGVVGIMSPWNFPVSLAFSPLAGVLAAGNRAMIKPSEATPETSALMARLVAEAFDPSEVTVFNGGPDVGAAFSALPFDHLVFTGSTAVGRLVMRAAAKNLTPVTLELGGKSPAIIGDSANLKRAATRIMHGKIFNAGQVCISPDYVLLNSKDVDSFVDLAGKAMTAMFPNGIKDSDDYTSMLGQRQLDRMTDLVQDARDKGARIVELNPRAENFSQQQHHKCPPTLVVGATDDMAIMQEEIFGPLLPLELVKDTTQAVAAVNARPRPLALYFFGDNSSEQRTLLDNTTAGGVTVNDTIMHISQVNLPFGGVGPSGIGRYHGKDGFLEFSHHKAVYRQMSNDMLKFLRPPYAGMFRAYVRTLLKK